MSKQITSTTRPNAVPNLAKVAVECPARSIYSTEPVLVVAPHPDDETLGCGGAIALLRAQGCPVWVLVITDGTQSHPKSRKYPPSRLRQLRQQETRLALDLLGVAPGATTFLQLPDGAMATQALLPSNLNICRNYLRAIAPKMIFLPWRHDPHPDHQATWQLITHAVASCEVSVRLIEYPIWDWDAQQSCHLPDPAEIQAWRLDIQSVLDVKQRAIAAYQSQTTDLIDDDPQGFRLTPAMLAHFAQPWEVYFEEIL